MELKIHRLFYGVLPPKEDELYTLDYFLKLLFPTLRVMRHQYFDYGRDEHQRFKMTRSFVYKLGIVLSFVEIFCNVMKFKVESDAGNLHAAQNVAATFSIALYFCSRAYPLYLASKKLALVVNEFDDIFPKTKELQKRMQIRKYALVLEKRFRLFHCICLVSVAGFVAMPIARYFVFYDGEGPILDDFHADPSWLPFGLKTNPKTYWYSYIYEIYMVIFGTTHVLTQEHLFLVFMMQLQMHFNYLIKRVEDLDARHTLVAESTAEFWHEFRACMKYLSILKDLSVKVNSLFDLAILCSDLICAGSICFQIFLIANSDDIVLILTFVPPLVIMVFLTFDSAKRGQDLHTVTSEIQTAFYNQNWYEGSVPYQRLVVSCIHYSSKPCKLTAFELFDVNMEHFRQMMSLAYQMFAFLQSR